MSYSKYALQSPLVRAARVPHTRSGMEDNTSRGKASALHQQVLRWVAKRPIGKRDIYSFCNVLQEETKRNKKGTRRRKDRQRFWTGTYRGWRRKTQHVSAPPIPPLPIPCSESGSFAKNPCKTLPAQSIAVPVRVSRRMLRRGIYMGARLVTSRACCWRT